MIVLSNDPAELGSVAGGIFEAGHETKTALLGLSLLCVVTLSV